MYFVRFTQGFQRVYEDMPDIVLDVPLAYIMLDRFVERSSRAGFLTDKVIKNLPSRFVLKNSLIFSLLIPFILQEVKNDKSLVEIHKSHTIYNVLEA